MVKSLRKSLFCVIATIAATLFSCTPKPAGEVADMTSAPAIYPDYTNVTIPVNIAPLNFLLRDSALAVECKAVGGGKEIVVNAKGNKVVWGETAWHALLAASAGNDVSVELTALYKGVGGSEQWRRWAWKWHVAPDSIDAYMTYRLIEPDYEVWNRLTIEERCIENFSTRSIGDHNMHDNRCMNCHIPGSQNPNRSMLYMRGEGGGALLNEGGELRKLNIKTDGMASGSVYYGFSPEGRHIAFSTNIIIPAFHSEGSKRLEVYDTQSDVYVLDTKTNRISSSPLTVSNAQFATFPTFSADGHSVIFCLADTVTLPQDIKNLKYSLVSIAFDPTTNTFGDKVDTLYSAHENGLSVCHPKVSPNGKWLAFTTQSYGTFPIWHREADQALMSLETRELVDASKINSPLSDTYHSWSSNSRWLCFASKRDDGLYGKPYFTYIDSKGVAHKPFVLPQSDPEHYDMCLKSYNAPELLRGKLPFDALKIEAALKKEAETVK